LLITDVSGLHAGVNPVSGDFSLLARGFAVKNGHTTHPVELLTIAGNFFELLKAVKAVGADLFFGLPGGGCAGSPSVLIDGLMAAGNG
jgi:PmbA protein